MSAAPADDSRAATLRSYARAFETLAADRLDVFAPLITDDVVFRDPFNTLHGRDAFRAVFAKMYRQLQDPRFQVADLALGERGYVRWSMTWTRRDGTAAAPVEGVSELIFAADGRVCGHVDHWDVASQLYERAPVLGVLMRALRRRFAL